MSYDETSQVFPDVVPVFDDAELAKLAGIEEGAHGEAELTRTEIARRLALPFPREAVEQVRKGSKTYSYINHAIITRRLIWATDNNFSWTYVSGVTEHTEIVPKWETIDGQRQLAGFTPVYHVVGTLTIPGFGSRIGEGVSALSTGSGEDNLKGAESDALKRAAMRFGVGIQLYKEDLEGLNDNGPFHQEPAPAPRTTRTSSNPRTKKEAPAELPKPLDDLSPTGVALLSDDEVMAQITIQKERVGAAALIEFSTTTFGPEKVKMALLTNDERRTLLAAVADLPDRKRA